MPSSVNTAFAEFLRDIVNLDTNQTKAARKSRNWLKEQINLLPDRDTNFPLLSEENHIDYGSFARRTKIRPLDDIDIMICLHGQGSIYQEYTDRIEITAGANANRLKWLCHDGKHQINSIRVINQFIKNLGAIDQYKQAELKRNQQAAVLNLSSYEWSYDIVPCFITVPDNQGKSFYLIPDGKGHWMKTDPRIDKEQATLINQQHNGNVLNVLRLIKYWNRRRITHTMPSYLLETIIFGYYIRRTAVASPWPDIEIPEVLAHIASAVRWSVNDPKSIQGDLNNLTYEARIGISETAARHAQVARAARQHESNNNHEASIKGWQEIFGPHFPDFD